jgi:hypothetical protein
MRTPAPPPGAMVVSATQNTSYASQYGLQGPMGAQYGAMQYGQQTQQPQYVSGVQQQPSQYGMPNMQAPPTMIPTQQQPNYGQQQFGQNPNPSYGQPAAPPSNFGQQQPSFNYQQYGQPQPYRFP